MKKRLRTGTLAAAALLLGVSAGSAQIRLLSSVVGAGGGTASGPGKAVVGTVGQGITGLTTAVGLVASQGFWYVAPLIPAAVPSEGEAAGTALRVAPNPISTEGIIQAEIPRSGRASLTLFDALGRPVLTLADGIQDAGTLAVRIDAAMLPSGSYTARLVAGEIRRSIRVVVAK